MKFDFIRTKKKEDFGTEFCIQICNLKTKEYYWSLFQGSISWNDFPCWPFLQINFGSNGFFSILFWAYKFGFDFDLMTRSWNWVAIDDVVYQEDTE